MTRPDLDNQPEEARPPFDHSKGCPCDRCTASDALLMPGEVVHLTIAARIVTFHLGTEPPLTQEYDYVEREKYWVDRDKLEASIARAIRAARRGT